MSLETYEDAAMRIAVRLGIPHKVEEVRLELWGFGSSRVEIMNARCQQAESRAHKAEQLLYRYVLNGVAR